MAAPGTYDDWTGNVVSDDIRSLDIGAVRAARAAFAERFPDRGCEEWNDITFLTKTGAFKRGKLTVASLILLGKENSLPASASLRWKLLNPSGAVVDTRIFRGPMILAANQVVSLIGNRTVTVGSGNGTKYVSAYRNSMLLEAVKNAVAHQDYSYGGMIDVIERENESVTVISKGSFPPRLPESFVNGPPQKPLRNHYLISLMAGLGIVPASSSGIRMMFVSQAARKFPMPDFEISEDRVSVRFHGIRGGSYARILDIRNDADLKTIMDLDRLAKLRYVPESRIRSLVRRGMVEMMDGVPCIASGAGQRVLSAFVVGTDEEAVLGLIDRNGFVTRADAADILAARDSKELTPEQVRVKATNLLQTMRKKGLIEKTEGSTRSARYVRSEAGENGGPDRI